MLWHEHFAFAQFWHAEGEATDEVRMRGNRLSYRVPAPHWQAEARDDPEWIVDMDLRDPESDGDGYILPRYPGINDLLTDERMRPFVRYNGYATRATHGILSIRT